MSLFAQLRKFAASQARAPRGSATGGQWVGRGALFGTRPQESVLHGYQRYLGRKYEELRRKRLKKFDAGQARVPAGNPGGGQWVSATGNMLSAPSSAFPAARAHPETMERFRQDDGSFTPERQRLHDTIIKRYFQKATPVEHPETVILGGGPASGKSTMLTKLLDSVRQENFILVDPDDIKNLLPEYRESLKTPGQDTSTIVHEESSYLAKEVVRQATQGQYNVILDGTGDSSLEHLANKVNGFRSPGRKISAHYVTADIEAALARNLEREKLTGRHVPETYLAQVHQNISTIFEKAVRNGLFDEADLYDTNQPEAIKIAEAHQNSLKVLNEKAWQRFLAKAHPEEQSLPFAMGTPSRVHPRELTTYLAAYGQEWKAAPLPKGIRKGKMGNCYQNASQLVIEHPDWRYAEGVAYSHTTGGVPFLHGWAVKPDGTVVDPTWPHPERNRYFGIAYNREKYLTHMLKTKFYGVLGGKSEAAQKIIDTGAEGLRD